MHHALSDKILERYFAEGILPREIRPKRCKREWCIETRHIHRHGNYPRKSVYRAGIGWVANIIVQRFRCARCGMTFSVILPTHFKWQRADLSILQEVALGHRAMCLFGVFSKRTLQRWHQKWNELAKRFHSQILQWILHMNPGITLDTDAVTAAAPLRYLAFLLNQIPQIRHSPTTVTAVARFGGVPNQAIPQCLSLSLPFQQCYPVNQGRAHLNLLIRGDSG